jgi:hypothetical protein
MSDFGFVWIFVIYSLRWLLFMHARDIRTLPHPDLFKTSTYDVLKRSVYNVKYFD